MFSFSARVRSFLIFSVGRPSDGRKRAFLRLPYNFHAGGQRSENGEILELLTDCGRADLLTVCGAADRSRSRPRTDQADGTDPKQIADRRDGRTGQTNGTGHRRNGRTAERLPFFVLICPAWVYSCFFCCPVLLCFHGLERE